MPVLLKRTAKLRLLGFLFLVSLVASALEDGKVPPADFSFASVQRDCAPNDALALNFYFTTKKNECGKHPEPLIEISIMRNLPKSAPYTMDLGGKDAAAFRCLKQGVCERATSGTLHLGKFLEGESASGDYELHFQDGSVEKAVFTATWCNIKFVCG
jgi:hypothetical protein